MRTRIKICGIRNPEDALTAAQMGADAIGLVFYPPSPRSVDIEQARAICKVLPAFVTVTALTVNESRDTIDALLNALPIQLLQFHGDEPAADCEQYGLPYIKAVRVTESTDWQAVCTEYQHASSLLLDTYKSGVPGGTGESFNWELIPDTLKHEIILAGGLTPQNVASAIKRVHPYGVDVSGGVECATGVKDSQLINRFIQEVNCADQS